MRLLRIIVLAQVLVNPTDVHKRWQAMCLRDISGIWTSLQDCLTSEPDCTSPFILGSGWWVVAGWPSSRPGEVCQYQTLPPFLTVPLEPPGTN